MRTTQMVKFGMLSLVAGALVLGSVAAAAEVKPGPRPGAGLHRGLLTGAYAQRIDGHIDRIEALIAKHPKMPADIKGLLEKFVSDLRDKKADLDKLVVDVKAKDKTAVEADRNELRSDRVTLIGDREALIDAHVARIEARLAERTKMPAALRTALEKLVTDLKDRKADLDKLATDVGEKDREGVKADRGELQKDRQDIRADRQAVREQVKERRAERGNAGEPQ
jgi:hypothetical protein